ncbi:MAG: tetratricopeptide repeat protein [Desulfuromonadaceae bacterium]|nr:tetratricopeptide repeat protein [Desulfuromonadaceae bacterium]
MKICLYHIALLLILLMASGCVSGRAQQSDGSKQASYHYQMGVSYLGERNYTSALIDLTEANKLDPDNPEILYNLGLAYMGKKRPDLAEPRFQRAIMLKPNYSVARNDLGVVYLELKRWDNAIQQFKIVKDDLFYQSNDNATINLGLAYLGKGDYSNALAELRAVATMNPRNPVVHLSLGRVMFSMGKSDQAIMEYGKALEIYSDYGAAYYYLGQAQLKLNRPDAARAAFKDAVRLIPDTDLGRAAAGYLELLK